MPEKVTAAEAKERVLAAVAAGQTMATAMAAVGRSVKTVENWRRSDKDWARRVDEIRAARKANGPGRSADVEVRPSRNIDFAAFRKEYLDRDTFAHQQMWVDILEGRDPEVIPGTVWDKRDPDRLIVNVPPEHPVALDTPVFTRAGWKALKDVAVGDEVVATDGSWVPVNGCSPVFTDLPCYEVEFSTGEVVVASGSHEWYTAALRDGYRKGEYKYAYRTTEEIAESLRTPSGQVNHRIRTIPAIDNAEADLPIDPYIFGYWLGDGSYLGGNDLRKKLSDLGVLHNKRIPAVYETSSAKQRTALLQGLMDSDGTAGKGDGRVKFCSADEGLARQVYRLVATLGHTPRLKREANTWLIYFRGDEHTFRLPRKAAKVPPVPERKGKGSHVTIVDVRPVESVPVACLAVDSEDSLFGIGNGVIASSNSKTQTLTVDYVTYRICMDPNVRVIIVSKRQEQARKSLHQIKTRLISPRFAKLQAAFAPEGGFKPAPGMGTFAANTIYVAGIDRDQQDPTVEALGIGAQIYGARADLIILDDTVVLANAHEYEKQIDWIESEVENRLVVGGKLLVIGTRLAQTDLYRELRNDRRYEISGRSPWSYLRQPYVLQFAENPEDWVTLWPKSTTPMASGDKEIPGEPGWYWAKPGPVANKVRNSKPARIWSLVYMQQESASNATFSPEMLSAVVNRFRKAGPLPVGSPKAAPVTGQEGMYVIAGMDPFGEAAICVVAVDRATHMRYVLDVYTEPQATNPWIHQMIRTVTERFGVHEWVIESNAAQAFIVQDMAIREYLNSRQVRLTPHQTRGQNKYDEDIGIGAMSTLFGTFKVSDAKAGIGIPIPNGDHRISLPDPMTSPGVQTLIEELGTWQPGMRGRDLRQDAVMALWFANIRAQHMLGFEVPGELRQQQHFVNNRFVSRRRRNSSFLAPAHVLETGGGY